ncbi:MAG: F0F1 ATP synthase subunit A [Actinomycetota bacterium]
MIRAILGAATFEPPSTKDFVYGCWGPSIKIGGFTFCFNFITLLLTLTTVIVAALFFFAFRKPKTVPGKLQMIMELGIQFVRENIAVPMLGPDAETFMPLLASFFFFILIGNLFEVAPGVSFSANSRVAIPLVLALTSWVVYNAVGIRQHGFIGYLRHTCIIPAAPGYLRYTLLLLIEFVSNILVRPITLTVRLAANFIAGHFLLAIFFLGTLFFLKDGPKTWILAGVSFPFAVVLVGFEIFVAALQAFIFAILSASYIGQAKAEEH